MLALLQLTYMYQAVMYMCPAMKKMALAHTQFIGKAVLKLHCLHSIQVVMRYMFQEAMYM